MSRDTPESILRGEGKEALRAALKYLLARTDDDTIVGAHLHLSNHHGVPIIDWRCSLAGSAEVHDDDLPGVPSLSSTETPTPPSRETRESGGAGVRTRPTPGCGWVEVQDEQGRYIQVLRRDLLPLIRLLVDDWIYMVGEDK